MDQATQILVIITSSVLIIFLLLAIYLSIQVLRVVKRIKNLTIKAENAADAVEAASEAIRNAAGPFKWGRSFKHFADAVSNSTKGKRRG